MAEYIEREALMKFPIRIDHYDKEHGNLDFVLGIESVLEYAEYIPAADVVKVVRCKDCVCWQKNPWSDSGEKVCKCWADWLPTEADDFCSYGERRNDGT